jgi:hypothetical protein
MSKNNIYDSVISELIFRSSINEGLRTVAIEVTTDQLGGNKVPADFNGNIVFTATVNNMPNGYAVKANSFTMTYSVAPQTVGSTNPIVSAGVAVTMAGVGQTFIVTADVVLENGINPDIVLQTIYTVTADYTIYAGVKVGPSTFTTTGLTAYVYDQNSPQVAIESAALVYPYFVIPASQNQPIYFRDEHRNVIPTTSFTITSAGGNNYYVLNWATTFFPTTGLKWTIEY